jgi:hypothetical protein
MFTVSFKILENPAYTTGRFYLAEDGEFTSSLEDILWFDTKEDARREAGGLPYEAKMEILSNEDVVRLELEWKQKKLEKYMDEKKKAAKLTKAEHKAMLNQMIRDGAKLVKRLDLTLPPISTKMVDVDRLREESLKKEKQKEMLNEIARGETS